MLVHAQRAQGILRGIDGRDWIGQAKIPQLDLAVSTAGDQLSQATALHVHVGDPLLMLAPNLDHRCGRFQALIEYPDSPVSEPGDKNIAGHLIGCQGSDTGSRTGRDVLD